MPRQFRGNIRSLEKHAAREMSQHLSSSKSSSSAFLRPEIKSNPFKFRGVYSPSIYRKRPDFSFGQQITSQTERLAAALSVSSVDMNIFQYVADPGFGTPAQRAIESLSSFDESLPYMTLDTEWLGRGDAGVFALTEIALSSVRGQDIATSSRLIAPGDDQANTLQNLISKARSGARLNRDEWRTVRDMMLYSPSSYRGVAGAEIGPQGAVVSQARWARNLREGQDLRSFLGFAEEGLSELRQKGLTLNEATLWFQEEAAARVSRGEPVVTWNGIHSDIPVMTEAFGPASPVSQTLSRAKHVDLFAASRTLVTDTVSDLLEPLAGRALSDQELRSLGGYLRQEDLAELLQLNQEAHQAGSDSRALSVITRRMTPILKRAQKRAAIQGASAYTHPGQQIYDPRLMTVGQKLYAIRGARAPYSVLYESGKPVSDPYAYTGVRANYSYTLQAIKQVEIDGQNIYGVHLQQLDTPSRSLFLGFEAEDDIYRLFQKFTPAPEDSELLDQSLAYSLNDAARRRYESFTQPRPGSSYGFAAAKKYYEAAAKIQDPSSLSDEELRAGFGFKTEAQIRDFRRLHTRLRSESGEDAGVLKAIHHIEQNIQDETARTYALASFMRRLNEEQGYTWEGPMEESALPLGRRYGLDIRIEGLEGQREINIMNRSSAIGTMHRILGDVAVMSGPMPGEDHKEWALRTHLIPAIEEAGFKMSEEESSRIFRHRRVHQQVEELASILTERDSELARELRLVPSVGARPVVHPETGKDVLKSVVRADEVLRMTNEAIAEAGSLSRSRLSGADTPIALSAEIANSFRRIDEMIRAPFSSEITKTFSSSQDAVFGLMRSLRAQNIHTHLVLGEEGQMFLGAAVGDNADELFATVYRRGWEQRDLSRTAWFELPAVQQRGMTVGGRIARPVVDLAPGGHTVKSRFEHAIDLPRWDAVSISRALSAGSPEEAERVFRRSVSRRLERAPWTRAPWDDPFESDLVDALSLDTEFKLQTVETTERLVREIASQDPTVLEMGGIDDYPDLMRMPLQLKLAVEESVQKTLPEMIGVESQLASIKGTQVSKYMVGMAAGDVTDLLPWGELVDMAREAPRQSFAMPVLDGRLLTADEAGIFTGSIATTARRRELEIERGLPLSSLTAKTALVGRLDILEAIDTAVEAGRVAPEQLEDAQLFGYLTTADEQIIISPRIANLFATSEVHEIKLDPDAMLAPEIVEALDAKGDVASHAEVVFRESDIIAKVKRGQRLEQIRIDQENATALLQGVRRDPKTDELILRFNMQREMIQGSRARVGTHKGVVSVHELLDDLFPGVDILYFGKIERRGQAGELAAGLLVKSSMPYIGSEASRGLFIEELLEETGVSASWVRSPHSDATIPWQLELPSRGELPMGKIVDFVDRRTGVSEELVPGGPEVFTFFGDFARLRQEERIIKNYSALRVLGPQEGMKIGPRERDVLNLHGLDSLVEWAGMYGEATGHSTPADQAVAFSAVRAQAGQVELPTLRTSDFGSTLVPIREIGEGYTPESMVGTIFDQSITGKDAFWLDLELPEYEMATGSLARVAVTPEDLLYVGDERYLGELNQTLRQIVETAEEIRQFDLRSASDIEMQPDITREQLFNRLSLRMKDYRESVVGVVADYKTAMPSSEQARIPGSMLRLHVIDSEVDRIAPGTVEVAKGYLGQMGIDPESPYGIIARYPTDPTSLQVVRILESDRVDYGQLGIDQVFGHAIGGDTDSDAVVLMGINSRLSEAMAKSGVSQDSDRYRQAVAADEFYRENVLPTLKRISDLQAEGAAPLGVYSEEALAALRDMGGYEQLTEDPVTGAVREMTVGERLAAFLGSEDVILPPDAGIADEILMQRQSASAIGAITNELERRMQLAHFAWGDDADKEEHLKQLADFFDIIKQKSISAQKHDIGHLSQELIEQYGEQPAIAVMQSLRGGRFDDLEQILTALGGDAKIGRDLTSEFVRDRVDIVRDLFDDASAFWSHPWLRIRQSGAKTIGEEALLQSIGPMGPSATEAFLSAGMSQEEIDTIIENSRAFLARRRSLSPPGEAVEQFMRARPAAGERTIATMAHGQERMASLKGAAVMGALAATAWLLPKAIGGAPAELSRPGKEEAGLSPALQSIELPRGHIPNLQATQGIPLHGGLDVLVRARSPGGVHPDEMSHILEQAIGSTIQTKLNVNTRVRDERTTIDRAWINQQVARAIG